MPPRPRPPAASFGPSLMAALLKGALEGYAVRLPFRRAVALRQRIYKLRAAMRDEGHSQYDLASRVTISILLPDGAPYSNVAPQDRSSLCTVRIEPADSNFDAALKAAGVDPSLRSPEPEGDTTQLQPSVPSQEEALEDFFSDLKR